MRLGRLLCVLALLCAQTASADPVEALAASTAAVEAAETPQERLAALGALTAVQEDTLMALRATLRTMPAQREALLASMAPAGHARFLMLGALDRLARMPPEARLVHPAGPLAALRAMTVTAGLASDAAAEAASVRATLDALEDLEAERMAALAALERAHRDLAAARGTIAASMSPDDDTNVPIPATDLRGLAMAVAAAAPDAGEAAAQRASFMAARGSLPLPARGQARHDGFGILMTLAPWAIVTSPSLATVRHAGLLRPLGDVVVLEPAPGALIVLQGLDGLHVATDAVVAAGQPVGFMGRLLPAAEDFVTMSAEEMAGKRRRSLYMELWLDGEREDAASWFALDRNRPARLQ